MPLERSAGSRSLATAAQRRRSTAKGTGEDNDRPHGNLVIAAADRAGSTLAMKAVRTLAVAEPAFREGSSPRAREGCACIEADEGWQDTTASTAVTAPISSETR